MNVVKQPNHLRKINLVITPSETSSYNQDGGNDCGCEH